jgi:CheY-like chemotaxis protein
MQANPSKMVPIPRILVSDDDDAFRGVLCEGLSRRGFIVTEARDGGEAIDVWNQGDQHLCLVDFHMPRVNGLEVVWHVQSHCSQSARSNFAPCLLMSGDLDDVIRREAERARVYRVLSKPLRIKELGEVITGALSDVYGWTLSPS